MKKVCLFVFLATMQISLGGKNGNQDLNNKYSIAIKEEVSWGTINGVMGYLSYRAIKKLGFQSPLLGDPLTISSFIAMGVAGMGLIDYACRKTHRVQAKIQSSSYVTGIGEQKENETILYSHRKKSKNTQTSWAVMFQNLSYLNATDKPLDIFKGKEIQDDINATLFSSVVGVGLAGLSIAGNPIGFKAAYALIPDAHPLACGIFSAGLNMLIIKTLYVIGKKMFFPTPLKASKKFKKK